MPPRSLRPFDWAVGDDTPPDDSPAPRRYLNVTAGTSTPSVQAWVQAHEYLDPGHRSYRPARHPEPRRLPVASPYPHPVTTPVGKGNRRADAAASSEGRPRTGNRAERSRADDGPWRPTDHPESDLWSRFQPTTQERYARPGTTRDTRPSARVPGRDRDFSDASSDRRAADRPTGSRVTLQPRSDFATTSKSAPARRPTFVGDSTNPSKASATRRPDSEARFSASAASASTVPRQTEAVRAQRDTAASSTSAAAASQPDGGAVARGSKRRRPFRPTRFNKLDLFDGEADFADMDITNSIGVRVAIRSHSRNTREKTKRVRLPHPITGIEQEAHAVGKFMGDSPLAEERLQQEYRASVSVPKAPVVFPQSLADHRGDDERRAAELDHSTALERRTSTTRVLWPEGTPYDLGTPFHEPGSYRLGHEVHPNDPEHLDVHYTVSERSPFSPFLSLIHI